MGDIVVSPSERSRPQIPYGLGGVRPPAGYGPGGMVGGGAGFGGVGNLLKKRFGQGSARFPGADPIVDPSLKELGGGVGPGGEIYDPESLFNVRGRKGTASINAGFYGGGESNTYDIQGRKKGTNDPYWHEGTPGFNPGPSLQQLRGYSSALGAWRGRPGSSGGVNQGAGFAQPDDMIRRLLMARMGGGL